MKNFFFVMSSYVPGFMVKLCTDACHNFFFVSLKNNNTYLLKFDYFPSQESGKIFSLIHLALRGIHKNDI